MMFSIFFSFPVTVSFVHVFSNLMLANYLSISKLPQRLFTAGTTLVFFPQKVLTTLKAIVEIKNNKTIKEGKYTEHH